MTRRKLFYIKNRMIIGNAVANFIGVFVVMGLLVKAEFSVSPEVASVRKYIDMTFLPFTFITVLVTTLIYERPIRQYLNGLYLKAPMPDALILKARQRLLNEPFVLISIDMGMWILAAFIYGGVFKAAGAREDVVQHAFLGSLTTGLITITVAFFAFEFLLQRILVPHLFPDGGLSATPKTLRIRIRTRLIAFLFACNLIPFFTIFHVFKRSYSSLSSPFETLDRLYSAIRVNSLVFMGVAVWLTFLVSSNLARPFTEIIYVLRGVRKGDFGRRVRVTTNDEIGYTGDVINQMTEGLKERERMRQSLDLAMEVQQNLLPRSDPVVDGLDIAGNSIYCDQTGGDYFDFLCTGELGEGKVGVVVGDVSDHGIPSALLMATARASLRQRSIHPGSIGDIVTDVNRQISGDVEETGQFMTLFYLTIDLAENRLEWVRAGHDPGILYDPDSDDFEGLLGAGPVLGLDEHWQYEVNERFGLCKGQIILIGTDGIWEAESPSGEMFGREPIYEIVRGHRDARAKEILDLILDRLYHFQEGKDLADDVTLVVVKVEKE
jgi:phosphoserine phosphatase RsbU/P